jgi:hypothetical protein
VFVSAQVSVAVLLSLIFADLLSSSESGPICWSAGSRVLDFRLELELPEPQCRPDFVASSAESLHAHPGALPRRTDLVGLQLVSCLLSSQIAASAVGSVFGPRA